MKYIAIDLGTKTMGIATSNGIIATARTTYRFHENDFNSAANFLLDLIKTEKFGILVVGYPKNMNNSLGHRVKMVDNFINILNTKSDHKLKIDLQDERLTTKMANNIMLEADLSRQKRKANKDSMAAQLILTMYLGKKGISK